MDNTSLQKWENRFLDYFKSVQDDQEDASHDLSHFQRVAKTSRQIALYESSKVDLLIILAAAYFHDIVSLPKNHPESNMSSRLAAVKAQEILLTMLFPNDKIGLVCHAIETHSFSANLKPDTIEAKILQDADRMEALGALGVLRAFYVSGRMRRQPYHPTDLCATDRVLDDKAFGLDHFYCKLFKLPQLLQTAGGRSIAAIRTDFLYTFVEELVSNVQKGEGGAFEVVWACYYAGMNGYKLFDLSDPFAKNRQLDSTQFVLDCLLEKQNQYPEFILKFLDQLSKELTTD